MDKNIVYNDFLNSGDIILGMSGGEGWGLPEFHSVGMGKHAVVLNAHSYKDWADEINSVLIKESGLTTSKVWLEREVSPPYSAKTARTYLPGSIEDESFKPFT